MIVTLNALRNVQTHTKIIGFNRYIVTVRVRPMFHHTKNGKTVEVTVAAVLKVHVNGCMIVPIKVVRLKVPALESVSKDSFLVNICMGTAVATNIMSVQTLKRE